MKQRVLRCCLTEGEEMPRFYGLAYYDSSRAVCYPIPLNLIINYGRKLWYRIKAPSLSEMERKLREAYLEGRSEGIRFMKEKARKDLGLDL
jgi:hypothetical protein